MSFGWPWSQDQTLCLQWAYLCNLHISQWRYTGRHWNESSVTYTPQRNTYLLLAVRTMTDRILRTEMSHQLPIHHKGILAYFWQSGPWLIGHCSADLSGQQHRCSTLGYLFHMGIGAVTWISKKQYIMVKSSTKAEYITFTHVVKNTLWPKAFLVEIWVEDVVAIKINCDNQVSITLLKESRFHRCSKRIDTWYHFIHEC